MLGWFEKHSQAISAISAALTALLAFAAIIGVKVQIDGAARIQQEQSARDIYREFLNLSVQKPEFAAPDHCAIARSPQAAAYHAFVDYLLYTGEQAIAADPSWTATIEDALEPHAAYLCELDNTETTPDPDIAALVARIRHTRCAAVSPCG